MTNRYVIAMIATIFSGCATAAPATTLAPLSASQAEIANSLDPEGEYTTHEGKCLAKVGDKTYIHGPCKYVIGPHVIYIKAQDARYATFSIRVKGDGSGIAVYSPSDRLNL